MNRQKLLALCAAAAFALCTADARPAHAGLDGQPKPTPEMTTKIDAAARELMKGDIGPARPNLLLAIDANPAADMTDSLKRVVGDDTTYNGIAATLSDAADKAADPAQRSYIVYNLARIHLFRARLLPTENTRRSALDAASKAADRFDSSVRDVGAWELKGEIYSERGDLEGALAAYKKITLCGGSSALMMYRSATAYQRANRLSTAEGEYNEALRSIRASGAGGPHLKHLVYQGLASALMQEGNDPGALDALARSAKVGQDDAAPFTYRVDVARQLLRRGHAREVLAYADAALHAVPDDPDAARLRSEAAAQAARSPKR